MTKWSTWAATPVWIHSPAIGGFWGYRISGFGLFGKSGQYWKKKLGADYEQFLRAVFSCFRGQIFFLNSFRKHYSVCTKKLHNTFFMRRNFEFFSFIIFLVPRKFSNLSVLHNGPQDWVFRLGSEIIFLSSHLQDAQNEGRTRKVQCQELYPTCPKSLTELSRMYNHI